MQSNLIKQLATDQVAVGTTTPAHIADFNGVTLTLAGSATAAFTVLVKVSTQELPPDFAAAASPTNMWSLCEIHPVAGGANLAGATGVVFAANGVAMYDLTNKRAKWLALTMSARTGGTLNAWVYGSNDGI